MKGWLLETNMFSYLYYDLYIFINKMQSWPKRHIKIREFDTISFISMRKGTMEFWLPGIRSTKQIMDWLVNTLIIWNYSLINMTKFLTTTTKNKWNVFLYVFFLKDWYPGSDSRLMGKSVEKLLGILENGSMVDVVLPGHNDVIDSETGTEKFRDIFKMESLNICRM